MMTRMRVPLAVSALLAALAACGNVPEPTPVARSPSAVGSASPVVADPGAGSPSPRPSASSVLVSPSAKAQRKLPRTSVSGDPDVSDVATDLVIPWGILPLRDGSLLVSERESGDILRVGRRDKQVLRTLAVAAMGEGGLLGLAIAPDQEMVFAYYTTAEDNRIVAMPWDGSKLGDPHVIIDGIPQSNVHNGGGIVVGPDKLLYVGTGDARQARNAQDLDSLGGKILRLQLDGQPAPGNPYGTPVFSSGHRNVQGLTFVDGQLWASEFGASTWDELNLIASGGNYGWPEVEGFGDVDEMTDPKVVWSTAEASPSGLVYWRGSLWMGALRGERVWEIPVTGDAVGKQIDHLAESYGRLRAVVVAADGDALLVSTSNHDSRGKPEDGDDRIIRVEWS